MSEKVTLRDVYDIVNKLDEKLDRRFVEMDRRVDAIESFKNKALGVASIFAIFSSVVTTYIWERLVGKQ